MKTLIGIGVFSIGIIIVSIMDAEDAIQQDEYYAEMVCAGHWPNYKRIEVDCE